MNTRLEQHINHMNDEQQELLLTFIEIIRDHYMTKGALSKFTDLKEGQYDTALPNDLVKSIQILHPNFKTQFHVFDYDGTHCGMCKNVAEEVLIKLHNNLTFRGR